MPPKCRECVDLSPVLFPRGFSSDFSEMHPVYNRVARTLPRVGPELGGGAAGGQLVRALESHYSLGVAEGDELVRPDARVGLVVVDQARVARSLMRITVDTFNVIGAATVAVWVHTELVFAARAADRRVCKKGGFYLIACREFRNEFKNGLIIIKWIINI